MELTPILIYFKKLQWKQMVNHHCLFVQFKGKTKKKSWHGNVTTII